MDSLNFFVFYSEHVFRFCIHLDPSAGPEPVPEAVVAWWAFFQKMMRSPWKLPSSFMRFLWPPSAIHPLVFGPLCSYPRLTCQEAGHVSSGVDELTGAWLLVIKGQVGQPMVPDLLVDSQEAQGAAEVAEAACQAGLRAIHEAGIQEGGQSVDLLSGQGLVGRTGADEPSSEESHALPLSLHLRVVAWELQRDWGWVAGQRWYSWALATSPQGRSG